VGGWQNSLDTPALGTQLCHTKFFLRRDSGGFVLASPRRPGLNPRQFDLGFVVYIVDLGQVFLPVLLLFPVSIIRATLPAHYLICHRRSIIVAFDSIVKQHTLIFFFFFSYVYWTVYHLDS